MFRTVGDAVGADTKGNDSPVVEVPKVRGSVVVWRVSLGLEVIVDMVEGRGRGSEGSVSWNIESDR